MSRKHFIIKIFKVYITLTKTQAFEVFFSSLHVLVLQFYLRQSKAHKASKSYFQVE